MGKISSPKDTEQTATHLNILSIFNRMNPLEPSLGLVTFFLVSILCVISFSYLDYQTVAIGLGFHGPSNSTTGIGQAGFLDESINGCDLFDGNWIQDEEGSHPLYRSEDCSFMDGGFRCVANGRPDTKFTNWRWQPKDCDLPRFHAKKMLQKLRNRRLVFAGDSIGRNQWESMLCMLSSVIPNKSSIYEINGSPITKHSGFLIFKFEDFNCSIEYYRAPFLVVQTHPPSNSPTIVKTTLKVDQLDWTSRQWRDADLLILNSGHWWSHERIIREGCYFQEGKEVKMNMSVQTAFRRSIQTVLDWVDKEIDTRKTYVLFRTHSPAHFRGGDWNTGGGCHMETLPELGPLPVSHDTHFESVIDLWSEYYSNKSRTMKLDLLNVTNMTSRRKDGHPSIYYLGNGRGPASLHHQDCSHWCLPGVPDSWNEIIYALFMKKESNRSEYTEKF